MSSLATGEVATTMAALDELVGTRLGPTEVVEFLIRLYA